MVESPAPRRRKVHPLRDAVLAGCVTFVVSAIGLAIVYVRAYDSQLDAARSEMMQIARTTATQIDGDLHQRIVEEGQDGTADHLHALAPLVRAHSATRDVYDIYTAVKRNGRIYWVLDSRRGLEPEGAADADPLMTPYDEPDEELDSVFSTDAETSNHVLRDIDGHTYLSAMVPFYDSRGALAGVLGIDMVLDALAARMADIRAATYLALVAVLLLSVGAGWVALRIRQFSSSIIAKLRAARAQAEQHAYAAEAAARAKADFLAMMSHEIRTPMNGMLGVADLLRGMTTDPEQKKLLAILAASGNSLLRIINDILDFSKIEASRLELRPHNFELRPLLEEIEHLLAAQARSKNLRLAVHVDLALPEALSGDRQRLLQVLMNLGTNAVKFTDRGSVRIEVRLLSQENGRARLEFSVVDTGIGISAEALSTLFSPFTQVAESGGHRTGTGLGLVIAQRLVKLMGGDIQVRSEPEHGSTFEFVIEMPVAEQVAIIQTQRLQSISPMSILVAEDNVVNQTIIIAMLEKLGHEPHVVANGYAAVEALASEDYDLVLMDCNMPVMDGITATQVIRRGEHGVRRPRVPIVALTANALHGDRETCLAAGMDDFLSKPVSLEALHETLESVRARARPAA